MPDHISMNYSAITDLLIIGTNMCCQKHFDEQLLQKGVVADISLESEKLDHPWGIKYFLWLPTVDHTAPTMEALAMGVQMLRFCMENSIKVYIHCKNGHGRAPTVVAAYLISTGMSVKDAIKTIAKQRREIHIEPVQEARLKQFAEAYRW